MDHRLNTLALLLQQHQEDHAQVSQNKGVLRAVGVPKPTGEAADSPPAALRARRPSEVPNPQWELVGGGSRPVSPITPLSVVERLQAARNKGKAWAGLDPDEATEKLKPFGDTTSGSKVASIAIHFIWKFLWSVSIDCLQMAWYSSTRLYIYGCINSCEFSDGIIFRHVVAMSMGIDSCEFSHGLIFNNGVIV